jgi:hypothetical protein
MAMLFNDVFRYGRVNAEWGAFYWLGLNSKLAKASLPNSLLPFKAVSTGRGPRGWELFAAFAASTGVGVGTGIFVAFRLSRDT